MKLTKLIILLIGLSIFVNNCSSFSDAGSVLRNEKIRTTDEFLIKKKQPLSQPPDFDKIPEPESAVKKAETDQNNIKKILRADQSENKNTKTKSTSTEQSILKQIIK